MWKSSETRDLRVHFRKLRKPCLNLKAACSSLGLISGSGRPSSPSFLKLRRLGQRCSQQLVTGKPFALFLAPSQDTSVSLVVTCINVCMCFALFHFSLFLWNIYIGVLFSHKLYPFSEQVCYRFPVCAWNN